MKFKGLCAYILSLSLGLLCCLTSCKSEGEIDGSDVGYISLKITIDNGDNGLTRSGTRESATDNESKVDNVILLFYTTNLYPNDYGIEMPDEMASSIRISNAMSFTSTQLKEEYTSDGRYYTTEARSCPLSVINDGNVHMLVIANSDNTADSYIGKTVAAVRDEVSGTSQWTAGTDVSTCTHFMMTSEKDAVISKSNTSGAGTKEDPVIVPVNIERLAARIDFIPNAAYDATLGGYVYDAVLDNGTATMADGGFVLTHVVPINLMKGGAYMFRRVAEKVSGSLSYKNVVYLGDEKEGLDITSGNFVIDPWTTRKTSANKSKMESYYTNFGGLDSSASLDDYKVKSINGLTYYSLCYTMENTTLDNSSDYSTAIILRGRIYNKSEWNATLHQPVTGATGTVKEQVYYIKHCYVDNESATLDTPMLRGIVRNNIYKISVSRVVGSDFILTLNVKPWTTYTHPEVTI